MKPRSAGFFATLASRPGERDVLPASRRRVAIFALLGALVFLSSNVLAQFTVVTGTGLPGLKEAAVAWGDYNKDGYLDVVVCGSPDPEPILDWTKFVSKIYRNNGDGTFTDINAGLDGVATGTAAWGDYDNDGNLDLVLGGVDTLNSQVTRLYHNNGNGTFTENTTTTFHSSSYGFLAWGDYNNDGYLDLLLSGFDGSGPVTKLYRNNKNGSFTEITATNLQGVNGHSRLAWADFNNDGYMDILLCGRTTTSTATPNPKTKIFLNNGGSGTFTDLTGAGLVGVWRGSIAAGDYDNDGLIDAMVSGFYTGADSLGNARDTTVLYHNNGDSTFSPLTTAVLPQTSYGQAAWGDFDADGYLDLVMKGYGSNAGLFHNDANGYFTEVPLGPPEMPLGGVAFGDVNNDGYLDILVNGISNVTGRDTCILYRNSRSGTSASYIANTKPTAPTGLASVVAGTQATLRWNSASDSKTPKAGLSYNLRVGSTPGGVQLVSPLADTSSGAQNGFRRMAAMGNMNLDSLRVLQKLTAGKYYWSVQSIDNTFAGSVFSTQAYFALPYTITAGAGPNGTITPSGPVSVMPDSSKKFFIIPASGYHVDSLIVDGARVPSDTAYTFNAVAANHTIRATFALFTNYTITASAGPNGTITPSGIVNVLQDSSQKFIIKPSSSYRVDSLIVDSVKVASDTVYTFIKVSANHTIRATFKVLTTRVSIAEARKDIDHNGIPDHLGDTLAVVGIVNSVNIQTTNFGYFIQDSSAGIHVFKTGLTGAPTLRPGYRIAVSGKIDYFRGTTEIVPFDLASDIVVVDTGNAITAIPLSISSLRANPEVYESRRIVLDVVQPAGFTSAQWPAAGASANLNVWNGKDSLVLRIDSDTEVDGSPYPSFPARVTGVATQFTSSTTINNDGYQITPMFIANFAPINAPPLRYFGLVSPANGSKLLVDTVGSRTYKFRWHPTVDFNKEALEYYMVHVGDALLLPSDNGAMDTAITLTGAALRAYLGTADSVNFKWTILAMDSFNPPVSSVDTFTVVLKKVLVGVKEAPSVIPTVFALSQNYPNPFNPSTRIEFAVPKESRVRLEVYNMLGQKIATLVDEVRSAGNHAVQFDASGLASGLYFYKLSTNEVSFLKKMMLLK